MPLADVGKALGPCGKASEIMLGDLNWSRMGIMAFEDAPLACSKDLVVPPELLLVSLALKAREKGLKAVLLLNARREHELALSGEEGLKFLGELLGSSGIFYFGHSDEGPLASLERVSLDLGWLTVNPGLLARAVEEASPVKRKVREVDVSDVKSLSALLVEKLGPPSFKEDLVSRIKGADKAQVAADALSSLSVFFNPTSIAVVGLKYAAKFIGLVRERRKEEYKSFLEMWKKKVEESFSEEKLSKLVSDVGLEPVKEALGEAGLAAIIYDGVGTPCEFFIPLLVVNLADELGDVLLVVDGASYFSRFGWAVEVLSSLPSGRPGLRLACLIHTGGIPAYEKLPELIRSFSEERMAIMDVAPSYVDVICEGRPASFRAALLRALEDAARERLSGNLAFVLFDTSSEPLPTLVKVKPGLLGRLKKALKGVVGRS